MITDQDKARAEALGRVAASGGQPVTDCPYGTDERVLRARWVRAYAGTPEAGRRLESAESA